MADCTPDESGYCTGGCVTRPHTWSASGARCIECGIAGTGDPCNDGNCRCECSKEYGPCEEHGEAVVIREGASTRTADDLLLVYVEDAVHLLHDVDPSYYPTPWARHVVDRVRVQLHENDDYGCRWLSSDRLRDELSTLADQVECDLSTLNTPHFTYWEDGYVIYALADDCPLLAY